MIAFELTMPSPPSWDGRWSGEDRRWFRVRNLGRSKSAAAREQRIVEGSSYIHRWSDGWTACVTVRIVDAQEARKLRRQSAGFAGYDWMIDQILADGEITG